MSEMDKKEIILQKIVENYEGDIPGEWFLKEPLKFGIDWKLFDYQINALENISKALFLYFNDKERLYEYYKKEGLTKELEKELAITKENENYHILSEYYQPQFLEIPFKNFINRASFWMATGSGKTLVMVKLIELLHQLMKGRLIPQKDILILAPKEEILSQIKRHVEIFNRGSNLRINLKDLKEWERLKSQISLFSENEITVFYYRADNVSNENKDKLIDYKTFYNNGNWYLILDEAHKGEKSTSKRQQYYTILSKNGFLFNFSATFTDTIDIITTVFDFKLDTFLREGYGKKIYIANSEFKKFKPQKKGKNILNDFSDEEKREIVAQTLILLAVLRKEWKKIRKAGKNLYHSPLLVTLANSVHVEEADLKIFFELLSDIARGNFEFLKSRDNLANGLEENREYLFGLDELDEETLNKIRNLTAVEFFENVFGTKQYGNIEVLKIKGNNRELAFKLKNASSPFMLIVASDIVKWEEDVLEGYEIGETIEESFFSRINKADTISMLLGSRIFTEGWDSNRPNIISFINIGVNEEAKKFVLQAIGRGIRIEPVRGKRKRFRYLDKNLFSQEEAEKIAKDVKLLETLFVFATSKQVVKNILEELEKQGAKWIKVKGIRKNEKIKEDKLPLLVPEFEEKGLNDNPFKISREDFENIRQFILKADDKVLILKENLKVRTIKKLRDERNFKLEGKKRSLKAEVLLRHIDNFFNKPVKKLKTIKILEDHIIHYQEVRTDLSEKEVERLEEEIFQVLNKKEVNIDELKEEFKEGRIDLDKYTELILNHAKSEDLRILRNMLDYKIFKEHYYVPILIAKKTENARHFKHIIKVTSEIKFLEELRNYLEKPDNRLEDYDWWFFSKIDESVDRIKIPYFDSKKGDYRHFCPDFIFWLKKGNNYYIKFIDPKGVEHIRNPVDKIQGFEEFKNSVEKLCSSLKPEVELYYFNDEKPPYVEGKYKKYWTDNFNEIFATNE